MGALREVIGGPRTWAQDLAFAAAVALTIAFLGPFGSYARPLEERLATSFAFGLTGALVFFPLLRLAVRLGEGAGFPRLFVMVAAPVLVAIPQLAVVALVRSLIRSDPAPPPLVLYRDVLAIALPFSIVYLLLRRRLGPARPAPQAPEAAPRLHARLPASLGRDVLALQAEDHYVRVHTAKGSTLLLMRLSDAIAELDGAEGERVHRSWWVARAAVASAKPDGRRMQLVLVNGVEAPVTREAVPRLRRAGWF